MPKGKRLSTPKTTSPRSTRPLQRVFVDLFEPRPVHSIGGAQYIMIVKDDYSRHFWTFFLGKKSESANVFNIVYADMRDKASRLPLIVYDPTAGENSLKRPSRSWAGTAVFARSSGYRRRQS